MLLAFLPQIDHSRSLQKIHNCVFLLPKSASGPMVRPLKLSTEREHPPQQCGGCSLQLSAACSNTQIRAIGQRAAISKAPFGNFTVSNDGGCVKRKCMKPSRIHALFHSNCSVMSASSFRSPARHNPRFLHSKTHIAATPLPSLDSAPTETRRHTPSPPRG